MKLENIIGGRMTYRTSNSQLCSCPGYPFESVDFVKRNLFMDVLN